MPRSFLNYSFLLLSPGLLAGITTASANCYYPNGTDRNSGLSNIQYAPINTGDNYSMCCAATDKPRSDGLCENQPGTIIYRESCTDQSWQSPKCIKLCAGSNNDTNISPPQGRQQDNDEIITPCGDGSYCCGPSGTGTPGSTCCNQGHGVFIKDGTTQRANPSATASSQSSTLSPTVSTTLSTNVGPSTSTSIPPHKSTLNTGAIAGGVVGGLAGLTFMLAAIWFWLYRKKTANKITRYEMAQPEAHPTLNVVTQSPQEVPGSFTEDYGRQELQAEVVSKAAGRPELDTV